MKNLICLILAVIIILPLAACGKTDGERVTNVFSSEEIELPDDFTPQTICHLENGYALLETDSSVPTTRVVKIEKNGSKFEIASDERIDEYVSCASFLPGGDIVFIGNGKLNRRGEKNLTIDEESLPGGNSFCGIAADKNGKIFLSTNFSGVVTDDEFNLSFTPITDGTFYNACAGTDGYVYTVMNSTVTGTNYYKIDSDSQNAVLMKATGNMDLVSGGDGRLWFKNSTGLYFWESDNMNPVCDFINSNLTPRKITKVLPEDDDHFAAIYDGRLFHLTRVPDDKVEPRTLIHVAGTTIPNYLLDEAAEFNRRQNKFRVVIDDYSAYPDADTKLRNDIISGKLPDVMIFGAFEDYHEEYINQKMFADLGKLIENDPDFDSSDLIKGVLRAGESNGKLYEIPTFFMMETFIIKSKNAPADGWTLREFLDWAKNLDNAVAINKKPIDLLYSLIRCSTEEFVDYEAGTCAFDSDLFRETLEFAKNYHPDPTDFMTAEEKKLYAENKLFATTNDKILVIDPSYCYSPMAFYMRSMYRLGFEDFRIIGYPDSDGGGTALNVWGSFAIVEKSDVKEAAWDFVKGVLTRIPEFTDGDFNCSKRAIQKIYESYYKNVYAFSRTGNRVGSGPIEDYESGRWSGYDEEEDYLRRFTEADYNKLMNALENAGTCLRSDSTLWAIIKEEAEAYFSDAKTLDETVKIIQNRAETYIAEKS